MVKLQILNPVALRVEEKGLTAPRLPELNGKVVGLYWNYRSGGDIVLNRTSELLKQRYKELEIKTYSGPRRSHGRYLTADDAKEMAQEYSAVIASTAD